MAAALIRRPSGAGRGSAELLAGDELAALPDEQVIDLIFSAGFSTAAEVSDISGRGVGMDVVRATVERIGGRVSRDEPARRRHDRAARSAHEHRDCRASWWSRPAGRFSAFPWMP